MIVLSMRKSKKLKNDKNSSDLRQLYKSSFVVVGIRVNSSSV